MIFVVSGCETNKKDDSNGITKDTNVENDNKVIENTHEENSYQIFVDNLKKEISKFDSSHFNYQYVESVCINDGYSIKLDNNGSLSLTYFGKTLSNEINDYKVANNVLSFYVINTGQDKCNTLYYINEDGTVSSVNTEYNITSKSDISIRNNIGNYKNIVSIVSSIVNADESGARIPLFIDINGNTYYE